MSETAELYHLQTLDSQIDADRARLKAIERALNENQAVRRAQAILKRASDNLTHWKTRQKDLELEREQLRQEAARTEERLYSGKVHNPRELTDMQGKLAELQRRHADIEEPIIEAMLEVEAGEERRAEAEAGLARITAEHADTLGALQAEKEALQAALADRLAQVEPTRAKLSPTQIRQYDGLRKRLRGVAVAKVTPNGECSLCGMQLTSGQRQQTRHGHVSQCPTCTRILYHP